MLGQMMDMPLQVSSILRHAENYVGYRLDFQAEPTTA